MKVLLIGFLIAFNTTIFTSEITQSVEGEGVINSQNTEYYAEELTDEEHYEKLGMEYNELGWNEAGFNIKTKSYYDENGFDMDGWNNEGYNIKTASYFDTSGYDIFGYNQEGYDKSGYSKDGWDHYGNDPNNRYTGTPYDIQGYDRYSYDDEGYDIEGIDPEGYDRNGWDVFEKDTINKHTGSIYDIDGYDINGQQDKRLGYNNINDFTEMTGNIESQTEDEVATDTEKELITTKDNKTYRVQQSAQRNRNSKNRGLFSLFSYMAIFVFIYSVYRALNPPRKKQIDYVKRTSSSNRAGTATRRAPSETYVVENIKGQGRNVYYIGKRGFYKENGKYYNKSGELIKNPENYFSVVNADLYGYSGKRNLYTDWREWEDRNSSS